MEGSRTPGHGLLWDLKDEGLRTSWSRTTVVHLKDEGSRIPWPRTIVGLLKDEGSRTPWSGSTVGHSSDNMPIPLCTTDLLLTIFILHVPIATHVIIHTLSVHL